MNKNRNIGILYAISFLQGMIFYGPIATLYRQAAGLGIFEITLIEGISLALCVLLELPWGLLADRIGYKRTTVVCCGLYFVSKVVFWKADGFAGFLLERILLSVVIAGISGVDTSILYLSTEPERAQSVFGIYNNLNTAGLIFAAGIYALLIRDNYRLAGLLTVVSYGIAAIFALFLTEVRGEIQKKGHLIGEFRFALRNLLRDRRLVLLLIGIALINETHQTITVFLNQLQYVRCNMKADAIGAVYVFVTLLGLTGGFSAKMTKRLGQTRTGSSLYLAAIAACFVLAATQNAWLSILSVMMLRVAFSLFQPLQTTLQNEAVATSNRATALSINAVLIDGVAILTNLLFGKTAEYSLPYAMLLGAAFSAAGLICFRAYMKKQGVA